MLFILLCEKFFKLIKKGRGFRDLTTSSEYYAKNMTAEQRISYLEQQLEYKDQEIEFLKKIVSLTRGDKGSFGTARRGRTVV